MRTERISRSGNTWVMHNKWFKEWGSSNHKGTSIRTHLNQPKSCCWSKTFQVFQLQSIFKAFLTSAEAGTDQFSITLFLHLTAGHMGEKVHSHWSKHLPHPYMTDKDLGGGKFCCFVFKLHLTLTVKSKWQKVTVVALYSLHQCFSCEYSSKLL